MEVKYLFAILAVICAQADAGLIRSEARTQDGVIDIPNLQATVINEMMNYMLAITEFDIKASQAFVNIGRIALKLAAQLPGSVPLPPPQTLPNELMVVDQDNMPPMSELMGPRPRPRRPMGMDAPSVTLSGGAKPFGMHTFAKTPSEKLFRRLRGYAY